MRISIHGEGPVSGDMGARDSLVQMALEVKQKGTYAKSRHDPNNVVALYFG